MKTTKLSRLCLGSFVFLLPSLVAAPLAAQGNPPARAARLSYVKGSVSLQPSGENQWSQASLNYTVTTGDRLYTDQGSRAEVEVGPYAVRLSETTDLTMAHLNDQTMQLGLEQGTIRVSVYDLPSGNTVEIDTPNGALTLLGPGNYRVDTDPNNSTLVSVNSGSLQVSGGGADQTVQAGQAVQLTGSGPIQVASVSLPGPDGFDQWCAGRDRRLESPASRRYVSRYIPGYDDLDAYGHWQDVAQYGPVWYPAGVPVGWVPYRFGRWVWIEPWGWTWVEDEPWGFAPFHYGRWAFVGSAWCWVPGPIGVVPVYAPALVAFVGSPGFSIGFSFGGLGVQAWFPLGPGEPFFPWYHYGGDYLRQVNITNVRNVTNITDITNINNINNMHYMNQTAATTVVPTRVFRSGQSVARQVVRVTPQQIAKAQVIPHPAVSPTTQAAVGGRPVPAPRIRAARFVTARTLATSPAGRTSQPPLVTKNTPPSQKNTTNGPPRTPTAPLITKNSAPEKSVPRETRRTPPPHPITKYSPSAERAAGGHPPSRPPLLAKKTPPPRNVPFQMRRRAMASHPGRPLEPQQVENLRAGKPAGPMRDQEFPPHREPMVAHKASPSPPAPRQQTRSASEPKSASRRDRERKQ